MLPLILRQYADGAARIVEIEATQTAKLGYYVQSDPVPYNAQLGSPSPWHRGRVATHTIGRNVLIGNKAATVLSFSASLSVCLPKTSSALSFGQRLFHASETFRRVDEPCRSKYARQGA